MIWVLVWIFFILNILWTLVLLVCLFPSDVSKDVEKKREEDEREGQGQ